MNNLLMRTIGVPGALSVIVATVAVLAAVFSGSPAPASTIPPTGIDQPSALERLYGERTGETIRQFGYDLFTTGHVGTAPRGAIPDDFVLGIGDELTVTLRGRLDHHGTHRIDSRGMIVIDALFPIPAAGLTLGQLRERLEQEAAIRLVDTSIFVAVDAVRSIGVFVIGAVAHPGRYEMAAVDTALDALFAAGGILKTGSLRRIRLMRRGTVIPIDLYDVLLGRGGTDIGLANGDRIIVPPIGATVAVAGAVKRPAVYELGSVSEPRDAGAVLALGGGMLQSGPARRLRLRIGDDGRDAVTPFDEGPAEVRDGDVLLVLEERGPRSGHVTLMGHVRRPGPYPRSDTPTLAALFADPSPLLADSYPLFAVIDHLDPLTAARRFVPFSPSAIIAGTTDHTLNDGDGIRVFDAPTVRRMADIDETDAPSDGSDVDRALARLLFDHGVTIEGAVQWPGRYPIAETTPLDTLLATAGGLTKAADVSSIEVTGVDLIAPGQQRAVHHEVDLRTAMAGLPVAAGSAIRVHTVPDAIETDPAVVTGEVRRPGAYRFRRGETLSSVLNRAGGLTDQAYPAGAVFTRASVREQERIGFDRAARELDRALARLLLSDEPPPAEQVALARRLSTDIRSAEPVGRVTVEADPVVLAVRPELDIVLEPGDRIHIPKRPLTVTVSGEVLSPANLQFSTTKTIDDYLREAGGLTAFADPDRIFIVRPDGSAEPVSISYWNHAPSLVLPGATIVVPRDPEPFRPIGLVKTVSGILGQLALTAASIAIIGR